MDQAKPIIAQWSPEIQILSLSGQTAWPYSSGALPLEVSPAGDRLTSVWPRSLISLNSRGRADRDTLLALFATTTADWIAGEWSPDNGALGSDGFWRAVVPGFGLYELNLATGAVTRWPGAGVVDGPVYPGTDGTLVILGENGPVIISTRGEIQPLPGNVPLASLVAVSTDQAKAAWISSPGGDLHFQYYTSDGPSDFRVDAAVLGNDVNWSMDWVNGSVVIGRSGYLLAVSPGGMYRFADPRLPRRWYRVRGGAGRLLLHSPEAPEVVLLAPSGPVDAAGGDRESFPEVLKTYVLEAGSFLEGNGDERAAEAFYAWALPLIRDNRSIRPLETDWADLEQEVTERRSRLRERF